MYPFKEGNFAIKNAWYVAAFPDEVTRQPLTRTILGQPVVMYRKEDGEVAAVGGRCPHRHYPLGKAPDGRECLKGDAIVCGYHGITFGPDGQCVDIPSQDFVPKTLRIPGYPVREHGMWVWIWMGDAEKADPAMLPDLLELGAAGDGVYCKPLFVDHVEGRYQLLNDNLLDLTHVAHLHGASLGLPDAAAAPEELTRRPAFLGSRRYLKNVPAPAMLAVLGKNESPIVDQVVGMDFYIPGLHMGIADILYPEDHSEHPGEHIVMGRVFHAVTPATHKSCTYFFAVSGNDAATLDMMKDHLRVVIDEDKFATEETEKMLVFAGETPDELLIKTDRNAVEARRLMDNMMDAERAEATAA